LTGIVTLRASPTRPGLSSRVRGHLALARGIAALRAVHEVEAGAALVRIAGDEPFPAVSL